MSWPGFLPLLQSGLGNLAAYLAAHVLLCLVPAFFIAGGLAALVPKESVTRFLGRNAPRYVSYPAAALAGSVLAVCSCTIVPLFAGIYKKGAGIGPAVTFLFFAPAANILALAYTGVAIGPDLALARLVLSLTFGIGVGLIMAMIFRRSDAEHDRQTDDPFAARAAVRRGAAIFLLVLVALLLSGTLKIGLLTNTYAQVTLPIGGAEKLQEALNRLVPFDASRGEEGVTVQGVVLIALLASIAVAAWRGFEHVLEGFNRWTGLALALIVLTLLVAALGMGPSSSGLTLLFPGKFFAVGLALMCLVWLARAYITPHELRDWLWESWRFVKQIFPLLLAGVFVVGVFRQLIRPEWIESLAGTNSLLGNLAGVAFGVFMYFPTLVEVPIAKMFLSLGMHRGPLLAYLMADPELSLQSILLITAIIGRAKAWTYVAFVALFSTAAGWIYGAWVDQASLGLIVLYLGAFLAVLASALYLMGGGLRRHTLVSARAEGKMP
ncbi:MAG TPA: permease [Anaerolineales bacterium]|nr:permease [Anaerolineales bacterium]